MNLQWRDSYATGVAEMDAQHKELFNQINALLNAALQGKGRDEIAGTLRFLERYVLTHFSAEEKLMQSVGFPGLADHRKEHQAFVTELGQLKARYEQTGATTQLVLDVQRRVMDWLMNHIRMEDQKYGQYMAGKQ